MISDWEQLRADDDEMKLSAIDGSLFKIFFLETGAAWRLLPTWEKDVNDSNIGKSPA